MFKKVFGLLFLAAVAYGEQIALSEFGLLNNNESSVIIDQSQAQDLLNVDLSKTGRSVMKRKGYGLYKTLSTSKAVHGGHAFFDANGNRCQVWGSSTSLWGIVSDAAPTKLISSATLNATWDCADTQGFAYCTSSSRDGLIKTNATTVTLGAGPWGTMVDVTPDRLVMAGLSAAPNSLYVSKANDFQNFTVGNTDPDAFIEPIASPGSKLTHIRYACGRLLWWKDQSFGYSLFTTQHDLENSIVSDTIGTQDNSSAVDPGGNVYFRGQDGHIYKYNCSALDKLTIDISSTVSLSGSRTSNAWSQTSQTDFQSGASGLSGTKSALSFTLSPGSVVPGTHSVTDTSQADFQSGNAASPIDLTTVAGAVTLKISHNADFTGGSSSFADASCIIASKFDSNFMDCNTSGGTGQCCASVTSVTSYPDLIFQFDHGQLGSGSDACMTIGDGISGGGYRACYDSGGPSVRVSKVTDADDHSTGSTTGATSLCSGLVTPTSNNTTKVTRTSAGDWELFFNGTSICTASDTTTTIFSAAILFLEDLGTSNFYIDNVYWTARKGNFNSRALDSGFTQGYWGTLVAGTNGSGTYEYATRTSLASGSGYTGEAVVVSSGGVTSPAGRYLIYSATLTATSPSALPQLTDVTVAVKSSGTFYSAVKNAPNLTAWDTFFPNYTDDGGSHTFYIRSATNPWTVTSTTPSWVAQTAGGIVAASTATYFQVRDDFTLIRGTQTPTLNDFTVNWFEGSASDKSYMTYHDDSVWATVAYGPGATTNNYILKYDLINEGWTLYNFGSGGFLVQNNRIYFGSTSDDGRIYKFGDSLSDNGSAIQAYWKSKDFSGSDLFLENEYTIIDTIATRNQNENLTVTYSVNGSTSTTNYTVNLSSATQPVIRHKKLLPTGKIGGLFNIQYGDSSPTSSWELLGFRVTFKPLPYRPTP